jgi:hypothetical protein
MVCENYMHWAKPSIVGVLQVARIAFNGNLVWCKCLICGMFKVARPTKVNMPF